MRLSSRPDLQRPSRTHATRAALLIGLTLALVPLIAGSASGHGAPDPLDMEVFVMEDEGEDAFLLTDGYDLYDLYVREAHWAPADATGLIFRFSLYGGKQTPAVEAQHIDIIIGTEGGDHTFRLTTTDDQSWEGDMLVVDHVAESDLANSWLQKIQAFVPYQALNVTIGDSIKDIRMASYVDDEIVDVAPGTFYVPGSRGMANVPHGGTEVYVDEIKLEGPTRYTETTVSGTNGTLVLNVTSKVSQNGQHLHINIPQDQPWHVGELQVNSPNLPANGSLEVTLPAHPAQTGVTPLVLHVMTDVGGRETLHIGHNPTDGYHLVEADAADAVVLAEVTFEEAPAPAFVAIAVATMGALAVCARRRA